MLQTWSNLLFIHWPVAAEIVRPLVPEPLKIDTWGGTAWLGLIPFTMSGIRPPFLPSLPLVSRTHELNVRTYVHLDGVPGVRFLSLDAAGLLAVLGARIGFHLPYFWAKMELEEAGDTTRYRSRRKHPGAPSAEFRAVWTRGRTLPEPGPDSLDFFLTERYCLYAGTEGALRRGRIFHEPWTLREATLAEFASTMIQAQGIPAPEGPPRLHAQQGSVDVEVWPLERV